MYLYINKETLNSYNHESNNQIQPFEDHEKRLVSETCQRLDVVLGLPEKAWRNEKLAMLTARIENRPTEQPKATEYRPELLIVPADYYGNSRAYYGD